MAAALASVLRRASRPSRQSLRIRPPVFRSTPTARSIAARRGSLARTDPRFALPPPDSDSRRVRLIDVDDMDRAIGKGAECGPEKCGIETNSLDLVNWEPVKEDRHIPFLAREVHPNVTVGRILRKRHLIVERDLVQALAKVFEDVFD